nr:MAG TPA: hypothetical protein [Caudoviricetes sp.]
MTHPAFILQKYDIKWICDSADIRYNEFEITSLK